MKYECCQQRFAPEIQRDEALWKIKSHRIKVHNLTRQHWWCAFSSCAAIFTRRLAPFSCTCRSSIAPNILSSDFRLGSTCLTHIRVLLSDIFEKMACSSFDVRHGRGLPNVSHWWLLPGCYFTVLPFIWGASWCLPYAMHSLDLIMSVKMLNIMLK